MRGELRRALAKHPTVEVTRRIEAVLAGVPDEDLRGQRAVEVLEAIAATDARALLPDLSGPIGLRLPARRSRTMRTTSLIALLLVTVAASAGAVLLAGHSTAAPAPPPAARAWEYKMLDDFGIIELGKKADATERQRGDLAMRQSFSDGLNKLGAEGWELVSVALSSQTPNTRPAYYFKRPK